MKNQNPKKEKNLIEKKVVKLERYTYFSYFVYVISVIFTVLFVKTDAMIYKNLATLFLLTFIVYYAAIHGWKKFVVKKFEDLLLYDKSGEKEWRPVGENKILIGGIYPIILSYFSAAHIFLHQDKVDYISLISRIVIMTIIITVFVSLYFFAKLMAARKYGKIQK